MELRYLRTREVDGTVHQVLQYRTQIQVPDYSTEKHIPKVVWTDWKDVPVVESN
jgi:hypothetical protein